MLNPSLLLRRTRTSRRFENQRRPWFLKTRLTWSRGIWTAELQSSPGECVSAVQARLFQVQAAQALALQQLAARFFPGGLHFFCAEDGARSLRVFASVRKVTWAGQLAVESKARRLPGQH
jgi:hypothetical protein